MTRWLPKSRRSAVGWLGILVVGGGLSLPLFGASPGARPPAVSDEVVRNALASHVPDMPTMSEEIAHYEGRLDQRGDEPFTRVRLFRAYTLAFRAYGRAQDLEAAATHLGAIRGEGAPSGPWLAMSGGLHLTRHEFAEALEAARLEAATAPSESTPLRLFDALWATGHVAEATSLLRHPSDPSSVAYLSRRARVLDADGDITAARDLFHEVVAGVDAWAEPTPVRAWARIELGKYELHSGHPDAAVARYLEALDLLPGSPAALEGLASVALGVDHDLARAGDLYVAALASGAHLDVMPVLATVMEERGDVERARSVRSEFVARATRDEATLRLYRRPLALLLAEDPATRGRALRLALADLAVRQDPGAWDTLGWTLYRAGRVTEADLHAGRAVSMGAPSPPVAWRAGVIAHAAGDQRRAAGLLRQALAGAVELTPAQVREAERLLGR